MPLQASIFLLVLRGYYYDIETELYFLKTRYYDPEVGRFISRDSIEYLDPETINGLNLYAYCNNNLVSNVDPNGNKWWEFWKWDWASIGKITAGFAIVAGLAALSVFTGGTATVIFAGAAIGAAAGFLGGGISGVMSGGGLAGFANGALIGSITGAISGAVAAAGLAALAGVGIMYSSYNRKPAAPRNHSGSRKEAYDKAFYKGGKRKPIFHPNGKFGPHFHPASAKFKHWHYYFALLFGFGFSED